jgi:hypothetical protein
MPMTLLYMPRDLLSSECASLCRSHLLQSAFFLSDLSLSISTTKSEVVLLSRRPVESPPSLTMGGIGLPISKEFKYLGVV